MQKEEQKYLYELIGNQIKELRKKAVFSQEDLANKLNLSRASIVNIENGRQHPSLHLLIDLTRILNVSLDTFLNEELLKEFNNKNKLSQIKKQISKASDEFDSTFDSEKILAFIKKATNKS